MTVQELIDALQAVEDKSLPVVSEQADYTGCTDIVEVDSVTVTKEHVYGYQWDHSQPYKNTPCVKIE